MKCISKIVFLLFFYFFSPLFWRGQGGGAFAQTNVRDSVIAVPLMGFSYTFQIPDGDLVKNYGPNSNVGGNILFKSKKNWLFGVDGGFLFGNNVKDTAIFNKLKTSQGKGFIITQDGDSAIVYLYERGYTLSARAGKVFSFKKPNPNSGIILLSGIGFLQHKKRIEITGNNVPELTSEYRKGYDRLSNGLALSQFVGYQYLSNRRLINFFGGFEFVAAFTKNRRGYNYDKMEFDNKQRIDLLYGFRFGWILPLYKKKPKEFYFY